ncbi:hypothetical protein R80B4_01687 [Fibrobacteres bacterium R8-0-B4]
MNKKVGLWLGICDREMKGARGLLKTKNYVLACYMCQQVLEKALKACIQNESADDPPRIHSLEKLSNLTKLKSELTDEQLKLVDKLDPFFIEARYPNYKTMLLAEVTPEACKQIIVKTEEFLSWIKKKLSE